MDERYQIIIRTLFSLADCSTSTHPTPTIVVKISSRHILRNMQFLNELLAVRLSLILTRFGFCGLIPVISQVQRIRIHIPRCRRGDVVSITYTALRHESHDTELGAEKVDDPQGFDQNAGVMV